MGTKAPRARQKTNRRRLSGGEILTASAYERAVHDSLHNIFVEVTDELLRDEETRRVFRKAAIMQFEALLAGMKRQVAEDD